MIKTACRITPALILAALIFSVITLSILRGTASASPVGQEGGSTIPIPPPVPPSPVSSPDGTADVNEGSKDLISVTSSNFRFPSNLQLFTLDGQSIRVSGSPIGVRLDESGKQILILPFALPEGSTLAGFQDPASGIQWLLTDPNAGRGVLTMPLQGAEARLIVILENARGRGQSTEGMVLGVEFKIGPIPTPASSRVVGSVQFATSLSGFPLEASVLTAFPANEDEVKDIIANAAASFSRSPSALAHVVRIEVLLGSAEVLGGADVDIKVAPEWVNRHLNHDILIARITDEKNVQFLETTRSFDEESGLMSFRAYSQDGFSTFALAALEALAGKGNGSSSTLVISLGVSLGLATFLAASIAAVLVHRGTIERAKR